MGSSPVRILQVITKLELGGAQQHAIHVSRRLSEMGFDVTLAAGPGGLLDEDAARGPFRHVVIDDLVREVSPLRDARALAALVRLVRRTKPDVVHSNSSKAGVLGRIAGRLGGARAVVHTVHGWSFSENHPRAARLVYRNVERLLAPWTDHFVSVSARDLETGRALGLVREGRGSVIRSGVDLDAFAPDGPGRPGRAERRAEWGVLDEDVVVVNLSCLKPQKAPLDFVAAAAAALRESPRLFFVLVGDGELRPAVEEAVARAGIGDRFVLAGWRDDVPELLRGADVFALTSLWEGLPRAVVQARLAGLPVVATTVNGIPEAVEDGRTGFLVAPGDVEGTASLLARLGRDVELRRSLRRAALDSPDFRREFDQEEMVRRHAELYRRLLPPEVEDLPTGSGKHGACER